MNFRLIATQPRKTTNGTAYNHTIWMGEFDGLQFDEEEAVQFARSKLGAECHIQTEDYPTTLH